MSVDEEQIADEEAPLLTEAAAPRSWSAASTKFLAFAVVASVVCGSVAVASPVRESGGGTTSSVFINSGVAASIHAFGQIGDAFSQIALQTHHKKECTELHDEGLISTTQYQLCINGCSQYQENPPTSGPCANAPSPSDHPASPGRAQTEQAAKAAARVCFDKYEEEANMEDFESCVAAAVEACKYEERKYGPANIARFERCVNKKVINK
mmetsp:Transcript_17898/g.55036  ORF Transcript_17898/g.55036 Transcript_17898/m.55036 type:complete len:210 (+) Transcript_17898:127-756(+)